MTILLKFTAILAVTCSILCDQVCRAEPNENIFNIADRLVDWEKMPMNLDEGWTGYYINLTKHPGPHSKELMQKGKLGSIGSDQVLFLSFALGIAWKYFNYALTGAGIYETISGCQTSDGTPNSVLSCAIGVASTIIGIGAEFRSKAKAQGWFTKVKNFWDEHFTVDVSNVNFNPYERSLSEHEEIQRGYEDLLEEILNRLGSGRRPELLGYAHSNHILARRDIGDLHPRAPVYRFQHKRHGYLDVGVQDHINGTLFSISYANHLHKNNSTLTEKRYEFRHQRFSNHVVQARFDNAAAKNDAPGKTEFNGQMASNQIYDAFDCFFLQTGKSWRSQSAIEVQYYDNIRKETFDFAALAMFNTDQLHGHFSNYIPRGLPITIHDCRHKKN